jgi:arylsulfatase
LADLVARNDLELFDLQSDPDEATNLAEDVDACADVLMRMNDLMNRMLDEEVGEDDGGFLPSGPETPWHVERWDI